MIYHADVMPMSNADEQMAPPTEIITEGPGLGDKLIEVMEGWRAVGAESFRVTVSVSKSIIAYPPPPR